MVAFYVLHRPRDNEPYRLAISTHRKPTHVREREFRNNLIAAYNKQGRKVDTIKPKGPSK